MDAAADRSSQFTAVMSLSSGSFQHQAGLDEVEVELGSFEIPQP